MSRPANLDKKKREILEAMLWVMSSQGYAGATIRHIAKKADVLPGAMHYYFENKQAILLGLLAHLSGLVLKRFKARKADNPVAKLAAYIDAHLAYGSDVDVDAVACWLNITAVAAHDEDVQAALQKITCEHIALLESLCEKALIASGRTPINKREIALNIYAAIEGSYHLLISAPHLVAYGDAAQNVLIMASRVLSAQSLKQKQKVDIKSH